MRCMTCRKKGFTHAHSDAAWLRMQLDGLKNFSWTNLRFCRALDVHPRRPLPVLVFAHTGVQAQQAPAADLEALWS